MTVPEHNHNGLYTRASECVLMRGAAEQRMDFMEREIGDLKRLFYKAVWLVIGATVVNIGGGVLVRLVIG